MRLLTLAIAPLFAFALSGPVQAGEGCPYAKAAAEAGGQAAAAACAKACSHAETGEAAGSCPCKHGKQAEEITAEATGEKAEQANVSTESGAFAAGK